MPKYYLVMSKIELNEDVADISELEQNLTMFSEETEGIDIQETNIFETDEEYNIL